MPPDLPATPDGVTYTFLDFELMPQQRALLHGGARVPLGSRAYEILKVLVERAGKLVTKEQLIGMVWPDTVVEHVNLRVHISTLRKALREKVSGTTCIEAIPFQGYVFSATVQQHAQAPTPARAAALLRAECIALSDLQPLVGRDSLVDAIGRSLLFGRFSSISGSAGVGKTAVALAVAAQVSARLSLPACLVDASGCTDLPRTMCAIAAALGLQPPSDGALPILFERLSGERFVLVLDSCDGAARHREALAGQLRAALPNAWLLTTSREPVRAREVTIFPLQPLDVPKPGAHQTPEKALEFSAVRLFCERACAHRQGFALHPTDVAPVVAICSELDGVPLALEFAAQYMDILSPAELLARLSDRFALLATPRRSPVARHQSMWAALEWGFEMLSFKEKIVLGRLSLFQAGFTQGCAAAIACCAYISPACLAAILPALVEKSWLHSLRSDSELTYRLLNTTRAYAYQKLQRSNDPLLAAPPAARS